MIGSQRFHFFAADLRGLSVGAIFLFGLSLATVAFGQGALLKLENGQSLTCQHLEFHTSEIQFTESSGENGSLSYPELQEITWRGESATNHPADCAVTLVDESQLVGAEMRASLTQLHLKMADQGAILDLDLGSVLSIQLNRQEARSERSTAWSKLNQDPPETSDGLAVFRDERWQWLEGRIGEITAEHIQFSVDDRTAAVKRSRVEGLRYFRPAKSAQGSLLGQMELLGGSRLNVSELHSQGERLKAKLVCGLELELTAAQIRRIDFATGRARWLSDFTPASIDWRPWLPGPAAGRLRQLNLPRIDQGLRGGPLQLETSDQPEVEFSFKPQTYEHGFAIPGGGKLAFQIDSQFSRLTGLVGFDPQAALSGAVVLIVRGDQSELVRLELSNQRRQNPVGVDISLRGIDRLVIEVDYADGRSSGDVLNLCEWRVHR